MEIKTYRDECQRLKRLLKTEKKANKAVDEGTKIKNTELIKKQQTEVESLKKQHLLNEVSLVGKINEHAGEIKRLSAEVIKLTGIVKMSEQEIKKLGKQNANFEKSNTDLKESLKN